MASRRKILAYILRQGGVIVGFALVGIACSLTCQYFAARCSQGMGTELRRAVYHQINLFSAQQVSQFSSSSLITRLTNDVNQVQQAVAMLIRLAIRAPFLVLGSLTMAMVIDRTMALIFLAAIVVIALVLGVLMTCSSHFFKAVQRQLDRISQITQENLEGQRVIRAFSRQQLETQRFDEAAQASYQASMRVGWISGLFNPATQIVINLGIVALLYCGSFQVNSGALSQGNLVALVNYMTQMFLALVVLANLFVIFTKAAASAGRIEAVLKTEPAIIGGITELSKDKDAVLVMDEVSFGYSEGESAIEQISFTNSAAPDRRTDRRNGLRQKHNRAASAAADRSDSGRDPAGWSAAEGIFISGPAPSDPDCTAEGGAVFRDDPRESSLGQSRRR